MIKGKGGPLDRRETGREEGEGKRKRVYGGEQGMRDE